MAYETLIEEAKKYLSSSSDGEDAFEQYYSDAKKTLGDDFTSSLGLLNSQYEKDKNAAAAKSMLDTKNMDQFMASRGLSRSGESVQERINSNLSLNSSLADLADSNARSVADLVKNKNSGLLSLEEKRVNHVADKEKWVDEFAFEIAKAENAKTERAEDIAREAADKIEERAYESAVRSETRAYNDAVRKQNQEYEAAKLADSRAYEEEQLAQAREYELSKIAASRQYETEKTESQRAYEQLVREAETELEAAVRAEKAALEQEQAERDQQYKIEYYQLQQADKERLTQEEREYEDKLRQEETAAAAEKEAEKQRVAAETYAKEQADKERLIAEQREYEDKVRAEQAAAKAAQTTADQENKTAYYQMQEADKERLIDEQRAYTESTAKAKEAATKETAGDESGANGEKTAYTVPTVSASQVAKNLVSTLTDGKSKISTVAQKVDAFNFLKKLSDENTDPDYIEEIEFNLATLGYTTPAGAEIKGKATLDGAQGIYKKTYENVYENNVRSGQNSYLAKTYAERDAKNAEMGYIYENTSDIDAFYAACAMLGISRTSANAYLAELDDAGETTGTGAAPAISKPSANSNYLIV